MLRILILLLTILLLTGCQQQMAEQPAYRPLEESAFFPDQRSARPLLSGTIPRGSQIENNALNSGRLESTPADGDGQANPANEYVKSLPFPLSKEMLERGQKRFEIFCAVCHGLDETGNGKIVERGYTRPPNYIADFSRGFAHRGIHISLRDVPIGYFFEVITKGYGAMPDYATQIPPSDRWAIATYVRALQITQHLKLSDLPEDERDEIRSRLREQKGKAPGGAP